MAIRCCKATQICCCLKYIMCSLQFLLLFLYIIFENILTIVTFIFSFGCFYYKPQWKLHTQLQHINAAPPSSSSSVKTKPETKNRVNSVDVVETPEKDVEIRYNESAENDQSKNEKLKILTQNMWVHYLAPAPCKRQRINAFIDFLKQEHNNYDILIIQEIFFLRFGPFIRCNDLKYFVDKLHEIGYIHHTKPSGIDPYFGQNGGIMLFSKYKFVFDDVYKFNKSDELMLRKGFAIAVAQINENYHLCLGTGHCDPYRPQVILSQIEQFSKEIQRKYKEYKAKYTNLNIVVGGDFNTRMQSLTQGLEKYFEENLSVYNGWMLREEDRVKWNASYVTYRSTYLPKWSVWMSILSCGIVRLPTLKALNVTLYKDGYCLDHILTDIDKECVEGINVVDTRYDDVFVSDHLGVELVISLKSVNEQNDSVKKEE